MGKMDGMNNKMDGNALEAKNLMKNEMKEMRGEMQRMGLNLQGAKGSKSGHKRHNGACTWRDTGSGVQNGGATWQKHRTSERAEGECGLCRLRGGGQNNSGDVQDETRAGDGKSDCDTEGKIKRGD